MRNHYTGLQQEGACDPMGLTRSRDKSELKLYVLGQLVRAMLVSSAANVRRTFRYSILGIPADQVVV